MAPPLPGNPRRAPSSLPRTLACAWGLALLACARPSTQRPPPPAGLTYAYEGSSSGAVAPPPSYAGLFGFRELRPGPGASEPFVAGQSLAGGVFNTHLLQAPPVAGRPVLLLTLDPPAPGAVGALRGGPEEAYFSADLVDELLDGAVAGLRARGVDARRDPIVTGPALLEPRLRAQEPLLVGGGVTEVDHEQRVASASLRLRVQLWLDDPAHPPRRDLACSLDQRATSHEVDLLALAGASLADCLLAALRERSPAP